jgi:hypothetical protein
VDVLADKREPSVYWELVAEGSDQFFTRQYGTIYKIAQRMWVLRYWEHGKFTRDMREIVTYHRTLREAKAMGIVSVRFNQAEAA